MLILLVACGDQAPAATSVLTLEEMPGTFDGSHILDNVGTSVAIQFTSGVPTMCNVAFGIGANYGALTTMPMMGGAIQDHAVTLSGLAPETTYHYRVTLTDEQARVYQSGDLTFVTNASEPSPPATGSEGENVASLAAGATAIGISSNFGGGIPPRILPILKKGQFLEAFRGKGRLSDLIAPIPVHVILNPRTALLGAAQHCLEQPYA